jgi:DNA-binding HxlR family transcriptional regulator
MLVLFKDADDGREISRYIFCTAPIIPSTIRNQRAKEGPMSDRAEHGSYGQFCPVAMASEIICSRWTTLVLREMLGGSTRFNDIRRGVPRMSPTLLSKRLKELEQAGVIEHATGPGGGVEYKLTEAGKELHHIILPLGAWGQRWVDTSVSLKNLDPSLLMWAMHRHLVPASLPDRRCTVKFTYPDAGGKPYWIVIERGEVELCVIDPGYDVDLHVRSALRSMTAVWMGLSTLKAEIDAGNIELAGDKAVARSMREWLGHSPFAPGKSQAAS